MNKTLVSLKVVYGKLVREFLQESGIHGMKIFLSTSAIRYAKHLWFIFLSSLIIVTHVIIINLIKEFLDQPTEVRLSTKLVHVANSPFPAVAICGANKISRRKMMRFAEQVYEAQQRFQPDLLATNVSEMAEHLKLLTGFFLYPLDTYTDNDPRLDQLHNILTSMYNGSEYPTRDILFDLSPDCPELIMSGMVFGKPINITKYFQKRSISVGACCLFNYRRDTYTTNSMRAAFTKANSKLLENVTFESNSLLSSVQFVLHSDSNDFWHTEFASYAFRLYFFLQNDYPTVMTNTLGEILVNRRTLVEIAIQPTFYEASDAIRNFRPELRQCYFKDEGERLLNKSYYSHDECLLICRMQSMQRYCGCVSPFLAPPLINASVCTLLQLPCLSNWLRVFNQWSYFEYVDPPDGFDKCNSCMPTCEGVDYKTYLNYLPLRKKHGNDTYTFGLLEGLTSDEPLALVKLFFKQLYAESTYIDIVGDWVALLSRFGGILSLFYGFSILSYVEIFYFMSGKWFVLIYRAWQLAYIPKERRDSRALEKSAENRVYSLYWNELQPKTVMLERYPKNIKWQNRYDDSY
ncbi:sodium channel protein Nach [Bactrocera neohumeralis]|uniref:sodium channel protein Nach n=1 Tax=Bactrocera neohumeralis TaxID=98809 RepID=UPI00216502CD|nr:sodium channel protein Nach [Bactrocera neohumeralis]